ncbi:hypothetical protein DRQ25_14150 [Candidatus Fermentibacteria bacterium]|nr:MAG: hypothetical protein DRQ25_14150 [Candidatus Fermentibacteria bacterium]
MLGRMHMHYMDLLQGDIDDRISLIRQFSGFRHNIQSIGHASMVIVYVACGIVIVAAALAGLLISLQT